MGWMLPFLHRAKLFLQSLWKAQLEWDDRLPEPQQIEWEKICAEINGFKKSMPRFLARKFSTAMLITFADASSDAMAACVYLRSDNAVNLLMAKGRLPPLDSKVTVPKLELNAMTLGMRLTNSVISQLSSTVTISRVLILSESEIALNWIKSTPRHDVGPFVKNRVTEVRKIMTSLEKSGYQVQFGHISSEWNPADCATRGLDKQSLSNHFWWNGLSLLGNSSETWDKTYKAVTIEKAIGDDLDPITISTSSVSKPLHLLLVGTRIYSIGG
ncbi:hypothetical protein RB195_022367 [Necator americanus]|uniref:Pao retrotransposon peptidase n=2 Tax=Necator americanus TaxID=51031 RepID=A0ABR1EFA4_NECAM